MLATLDEAGFEAIGERDLHAEVAPATEKLSNLWKLFGDQFTPRSEPGRTGTSWRGSSASMKGCGKACFLPSDPRHEADAGALAGAGHAGRGGVAPGFCAQYRLSSKFPHLQASQSDPNCSINPRTPGVSTPKSRRVERKL